MERNIRRHKRRLLVSTELAALVFIYHWHVNFHDILDIFTEFLDIFRTFPRTVWVQRRLFPGTLSGRGTIPQESIVRLGSSDKFSLRNPYRAEMKWKNNLVIILSMSKKAIIIILVITLSVWITGITLQFEGLHWQILAKYQLRSEIGFNSGYHKLKLYQEATPKSYSQKLLHRFGRIWSDSVRFDQIWSDSVRFGQIWSDFDFG